MQSPFLAEVLVRSYHLSQPTFKRPQIPVTEAERLEALKALHLVDTPPEIALDEITTLASQICGVPISLISIIDENRQWFKSKVGLEIQETSRDISFCAHAVYDSKTLIIEDALLDERFQKNPVVTGAPNIRFYAGAPLTLSSGHSIGALCVIDRVPRKLTAQQIAALEILSRQVVLNFEKNKLARELIIQKNFFSSIVKVLPELISYVDSQCNPIFRNEAFLKWFPITTSDLHKVSLEQIFGSENLSHMKPYMDQVLQGKPQDFEIKIKVGPPTSPTEKIIRATYLPDLDTDGTVRGFFSVISDITEVRANEKKAIYQTQILETAFQESRINEQIFRSYFENAAIGMIKLDSNLNFLDANPAYLKMIEFNLAELKNKNLVDVTFEEDKQNYSSLIKTKAEAHSAFIRYEKRSLTKSGKIIYLQVSGQSVPMDNSMDYQIFMVIQDVSALKEAEALLQEQQIKMIQSSKLSALGEMAGGIAHEINNPLAIIIGKLDLLKRLYEGEKQNHPEIFIEIDKIESTTNRISKIVRGLRAFSRDSSNDPCEIVKVETIISNTISLCSERLTTHGIKTIVECSAQLELNCRPTDISQILLNLLSNSFDALQTVTEKWIKIRVIEQPNKFIQIEVIDSGLGIPAAARDKIMQPFFTTKEIGKGTGLGLSVSKGLAQANGGELMLDTTSPQTKFILKLPTTTKN